MPEPLKNHYSHDYFTRLCSDIRSVQPTFEAEEFLLRLFDDAWPTRELKARMHHITHCLDATLTGTYSNKLELLKKVAPLTGKNSKHSGFLDMLFPDFVEQYGGNHFIESLDALEFFTQFSSSEFAIRPFIVRYPQKTMQRMLQWSTSDNHHTRRLASEGCRPRLPWGMALQSFKKDPSDILPILENLRQDDSEYVRKSVANNLNDISKDHPQLVLDIAHKWYGTHPHTDRIVKHACRTLLKSANQNALAIFGYADTGKISAQGFSLNQSTIRKGESISLSCQLVVEEKSQLRIEYKVQFAKANGKTSHKVFKISERESDEGIITLQRNHAFADLSTRKHHPGTHRISLLVNGKELASASFELTS